MSLFDAFSGAPGNTAYKNNLAAIGQGQQLAGNALTNTSQNALDYLLGKDGQGGGFQYTTQGYNNAKSDLSNQYGATQGYLGQLGALYQPLTQGGQAAYSKYLDATGANGAEGSARAAEAYQASPGFQYSLDTALGAVQRSAAARGGLAGGNATSDILKTATGLASQGYNSYLQNLGNAAQSYQQGLAGQAQGLNAQGQASQNYGTGLSALGYGQGNAQANILAQGANVQQGLGQGFLNLANNSTNAITNANNARAASQMASSQNALGAILGVGKLAAGALGGGFGGFGGFASSLGGSGDLGGDGDLSDWV